VIVMFAPVAHELTRLHGLGLPVQLWWHDVLAHELGHLNGHWHGAGRDAHNIDADNLLAALVAMQARGGGQPSASRTGQTHQLHTVARTIGTALGLGVAGVALAGSALIGLTATPADASPLPGRQAEAAAQSASLATGAPVRVFAGDPVGREIEFTAGPTDRAGDVARGLGYRDSRFAEFNQLNGNRFAGPDEFIGGQTVRAPATWTGVWIAQPGDSYWRIYVDRFGKLTAYYAAIAGKSNPDQLDKQAPVRVEQPGQGPTETPKPTPTETPKPTPSQTPSASPTTSPSPTQTTTPPGSGPSHGFPWQPLAVLGGAALTLLAAFYGLRHLGTIRATIGGFFTRIGGWVGGLNWRAVGSTIGGVGAAVAGVGAAVAGVFGLAAVTGASVTTVAAVTIAASWLAIGARGWWSAIQIRAPTWRGAVRDWLLDTRIALENTYGFSFTDIGDAIGRGVRATGHGVLVPFRAVGHAAQFLWQRWTFVWEHRIYPTAAQFLVALIPGIGPWLAGSMQMIQLLHLKLVYDAAGKAVDQLREDQQAELDKRAAAGEAAPGRFAAFRAKLARIRAFVARLKYNRAFTSWLPWMTPPAGPEFMANGWFGFGFKISYGNLGTFTVLDLADLGRKTIRRTRVFGGFPVVRVGVQIYLGPVRVEFGFLHFDVPGKKVDRAFDAPKVSGWQRLNVYLRVRNWFAVQDWNLWTWKPFEFLSQTQFLVGLGPRNALLPSFIEYRWSLQKIITHYRDGRPDSTFDSVYGVGPAIGGFLGGLAEFVGWHYQFLPRWVRAPAEWVGHRVWRKSLAERRAVAVQHLNRRGLARFDAVIATQLTARGRLQAAVDRVERQIMRLAFGIDGSVDLVLYVLLRHRESLISRLTALDAAIRHNLAARQAIEEGPGTKPEQTPALPRPLVMIAPSSEAGVRQSGTLPGDLAKPGSGRVGFDLGDLAGRSDPGHQNHRNLDALAGAVRSADGRVFAALADQQAGQTSKAGSNAQVAVRAAMAAALAADPSMSAGQVARVAFEAARVAAGPAAETSTLLLVVVTPTGPDSSRVAFVWVGDSRGYLVRPDGTTTQVTEDHTWSVAHTVEGAAPANPIQYVTSWVGRDAAFQPGIEVVEVHGPATVVLTTDELHDFMPNPADIGAVVTASGELGDAADQLIDRVASKPGNKTTILIRLNPAGGTPAASIPRGGSGGHGPLAKGGMNDEAVHAFAEAMPELLEQAMVQGGLTLPFMARGPPVLLLDPALARPILARYGLADL
ncbi:MAG TPA: protein phosphatase 2C domain-containing protein, partial [Pseudonocardia sp.]|uniref:PP2C family protein-serine/threonine phosphatase n=1 Tax=Pseudonocardia sp. TaxID=60912 RepID=UPI002EDB4E26